MGRYSYGLASDLDVYGQAVRAGRKPVGSMRVSDALQPLRNLVSGGFETGRLDLRRLDAVAPGATGKLMPLLQQWQSAGLLDMSGDVVTLTVAGRFWYSNLIFACDAILCDPVPPGVPSPVTRPFPKQHEAKELS